MQKTPSLDDLPDLATVHEVAQVLRCKPPSVTKLCASGQLRASRVLSRWLITPEAVKNYLKECEVCPDETKAPTFTGGQIGASGKFDGSSTAKNARVRRAQKTLEKLRSDLKSSRQAKSQENQVIPLKG